MEKETLRGIDLNLEISNATEHKYLFEKRIVDFVSLVRPVGRSKFISFELDTFDFEDPVEWMKLAFTKIKLINCKLPALTIVDSQFDELQLVNCTIGKLKTENTRFLEGLNITDCEIDNLEISLQNTPRLIISNTDSTNKTNIKPNITSGIIKKAKINIHQISSLTVQRAKFSEFEVTGNTNTYISFLNSIVKKAKFNCSDPSIRLVIDNIIASPRAGSLLEITTNQLKTVEIINSKLKKFDAIGISASKISNLAFRNITWKSNVLGEKSIEQNRELKNKLLEQGNKVDAIFFQGYELEAHRRSLRGSSKYTDRLILWIYKWSNFYRLNLWLPAVWFIVFGAVFYAGILAVECKSVEDYWGHYFLFLNPVHRINFMGFTLKEEISIFLDFVGRLFLSFFIYQFIQSFRRLSLK